MPLLDDGAELVASDGHRVEVGQQVFALHILAHQLELSAKSCNLLIHWNWKIRNLIFFHSESRWKSDRKGLQSKIKVWTTFKVSKSSHSCCSIFWIVHYLVVVHYRLFLPEIEFRIVEISKGDFEDASLQAFRGDLCTLGTVDDRLANL